MFDTPVYGWVNIKIGDWSDRASYLTNPHYDMLNGFINFYKNFKPFCVFCDAEGWDYIIVINHYTTHIIEAKDAYVLSSIEVNHNVLAKELISDIERDIDAWSDWDLNKDSVETEKVKIQEKLKELKDVFEEYQRRWNKV